MRTYYIYKATNKVNGKLYIGQTANYHARVQQHYMQSLNLLIREKSFNAT